MSDVTNILLLLGGGVFLSMFFGNILDEHRRQQFNKQRDEALDLDKDIEKIKTEVTRGTDEYEKKLEEYYKRFPANRINKPDGDGDSNN